MIAARPVIAFTSDPGDRDRFFGVVHEAPLEGDPRNEPPREIDAPGAVVWCRRAAAGRVSS